MLILLDFLAQSVAKRVTYFKAQKADGRRDGLRLTTFSEWIPLSLSLSPAMSKKITIHLSLSPSLPCRLQTKRVLNIDGSHREAQAVGASVTPGDVEHRHDTRDVLEGALCFFKQQNYFFPLFFIIRCWFLSQCQFQMCFWSPCLFLLTFVAMKEREHSEGGFAGSELPGAGIRPSFLEKFRWRGALNDLQMGSHLPASLDWSLVIWHWLAEIKHQPLFAGMKRMSFWNTHPI